MRHQQNTQRTHQPIVLDGSTIKQLRQVAGLSQRELGELLKCSQENISFYERRGLRTKINARRVLDALLPNNDYGR